MVLRSHSLGLWWRMERARRWRALSVGVENIQQLACLQSSHWQDVGQDVLGAVGAFKRGNIRALSLFSPLVLFCVFNSSRICGPGMESCKDLCTGKSPVGTGGGRGGFSLQAREGAGWGTCLGWGQHAGGQGRMRIKEVRLGHNTTVYEVLRG